MFPLAQSKNRFVAQYHLVHNIMGPARGTRIPAFTQVFRTNHAQKLPEIHVHAKFTHSRWM